MSLIPGTKLGPYEIVTPIGAGGMGEVYKARDSKLDRDVAIKVLPESFSVDADRVARFTREAKTLASLNHPNIAQIYGIEDTALVMEFVDGDDLTVRIARGAMALDEVLSIARQIAEALEAAHEQGIVHRDLKPANIKVRADGTVKVLDFGLAKAMDPSSGSNVEAMNSPTLTAHATQMGMIIGTAAYMAPEQAKGRAVDKRADIWAFGVVLFETLSGTRGYQAEDISDTLAAVLTREVDWTQLPSTTPAPLVALLHDCLVRDPKQRLRDMGEARRVLDKLITGHSGSTIMLSPSSGVTAPPPAPAWTRALPWSVAGLLGAGLVASLFAWAPWRTTQAPTPRKLLAGIGSDASLSVPYGAAAILSPDGTMLAFVAVPAKQGRPALFVRKLDELQATPLAGTDGATSPFFSPDGQWIGYFAGGQLKKVSTTGGASIKLCDAPDGRGGAWTDDDTIIFTPGATGASTRLMRVPAEGGAAAAFGALGAGAVTQRWPQALPDGRSVLYTEHAATTGYDAANLVVAPLSDGAPKIVFRGGYYGRYVSGGTGGGHLIYMNQGTLFAVRFDLDRLETVGPAVPAIEGITASTNGGVQVAVSSDGTIVYAPGAGLSLATPIEWLTRDGKTSLLRADKAIWQNPQFSPDGRKLAINIFDGKQNDVWVYEVARATLTQLTFDAAQDMKPVWTPDGRRIVFASDRAKAVMNLYWVNADGTGQVTRLTDSSNTQWPQSWHPSGKFLAFSETRGATASDLMLLPMEGDATRGWTPGTPTVFLGTPAAEGAPTFSPDGRFIAYTSTAASSSNFDVYVRPFPGSGGPWRISTTGGIYSEWSATTHEVLFLNYLDPTPSKIMAAPYVVVGDSFQPETPKVWSSTRVQWASPTNGAFDLHPDGKRIAASAVPDLGTTVQDKVVFIFNFAAHLARIAPGKK